jgi:hypothetical protein
MAKGKENVRKKELENAIDGLGKIGVYEEVSSSELLKSEFAKLELGFHRELRELNQPGKKYG